MEGINHNVVMVNGVLEALWHLGLQEKALKFFSLAKERDIFEESFRKSETVWAIDVHRYKTQLFCCFSPSYNF